MSSVGRHLFRCVPLTHGPQREHHDHRDAGCARHCSDQQTEPIGGRTITVALEIDERVTDEPAAHTADDDGGQSQGPSRARRCSGDRRDGWWFMVVGHGTIVSSEHAADGLGAPRRVIGVRTLVVLPTFDEAENIDEVLRRVRAALSDATILVVDDGSPDGTADIVDALAVELGPLEVLRRRKKAGLGSAYRAGFRIGIDRGFEALVEMDSDLSHDPSELPGLVAAAQRFDLVVGSRYIPGGSVTDWSRSRVALSRGGNAYAGFMLGLPIRDATSGYRVYRRELLHDLLQEPFASDGYGFQIELVSRAYRLGYHVGEAPITFRERVYGESKISKAIVAEALWSVTRWGWDLRFHTRQPA